MKHDHVRCLIDFLAALAAPPREGLLHVRQVDAEAGNAIAECELFLRGDREVFIEAHER